MEGRVGTRQKIGPILAPRKTRLTFARRLLVQFHNLEIGMIFFFNNQINMLTKSNKIANN